MKKKLLRIGILFAFLFILVIFIYPKSNKEYIGNWYGFFTGIVHDACLISNWIFSIFNPKHLIKATLIGPMYNGIWWFMAIYFNFLFFIKPFMNYIIDKKKDNDKMSPETRKIINSWGKTLKKK